VIFLGIGGLLAVVAVVAGGSDERDSVGRLRVELFQAPTGADLVVYVQDQHNRPEVADNRPQCDSSAPMPAAPCW
jgi:hypothetical protein